MSEKTPIDLLKHAAKRASTHPFFFAGYLDRFRLHRGMQEDDLADFLGCSVELLPKIALCRQPDPEDSNFHSDVHKIADAFGVHVDRLVQLIREVDSLKAIGGAASFLEQITLQGLMMAARDRDTEEPDQEEPEDRDSTGKGS